jgi:hypothetical protein
MKAQSLCIQEIAESFRKGRTFVEQYFESLVAHVAVNGVHHEADDSFDLLGPLITMDPVAGAFKMWVLDTGSPRVEGTG